MDKVFLEIIPKIPTESLPIYGVEILLEFSLTLKSEGLEKYYVPLRRRLRSKISSLLYEVDETEFPLTSLYQKNLAENSEPDQDESFEEIPPKRAKTSHEAEDKGVVCHVSQFLSN